MTALALAALLAPAWSGDMKAPMAAPVDKNYGVLLLGGGGDLNWKAAVEGIRRQLTSKGRPFEFAQGPADAKEIQKAVDLLQTRGVKKIAVVPLYLSSFDEVMDEDRYLFGIRQSPPAAFGEQLKRMGARAQPRLKIKVPVVMSRALDDNDTLVDLLAARAKALSREPAKETLVLIGQAPNAPEDLKDWQSAADTLAEKARAKAGLLAAKSGALSEGLSQKDRDASEAAVKKLVGALSAQGPVIVLPLELSQGVIHIRLARVLEGAFARIDSKPLLSDARFADWVDKSAQEAAKLPDMRVFKSAGSGFSTIAPAQPLNFGSKPGAIGGH